MGGNETLRRVQFAIPHDRQPADAHLPTVLTVPIVEIQRIIPVCFACHRGYALPDDNRIVGMLLNDSYITWNEALKEFFEHQHRKTDPSIPSMTDPGHGRIIEQVDHKLILYNAGVIFQDQK